MQWVKLLLSKFLVPVRLPPTLFSNNFCATYLFANPIFYSPMTHLAIDYHFVRDLVQLSELCVAHVSVGDQLASFTYVTRLVLFLVHHREGAY